MGGGDVAGGWWGNERTKRRGEIRAPAKPGVKLGAMHVKTQSLQLQLTEARFEGWTRTFDSHFIKTLRNSAYFHEDVHKPSASDLLDAGVCQTPDKWKTAEDAIKDERGRRCGN